jgi:hypothetical protein
MPGMHGMDGCGSFLEPGHAPHIASRWSALSYRMHLKCIAGIRQSCSTTRVLLTHRTCVYKGGALVTRQKCNMMRVRYLEPAIHAYHGLLLGRVHTKIAQRHADDTVAGHSIVISASTRTFTNAKVRNVIRAPCTDNTGIRGGTM